MPESIKYNQYFSSHPVISIAMPNGKQLTFVGGTYITNNQEEIKFLDAEVLAGNPIISVKKGQEQISSTELDPLAAIKKKAVEEYLEQQKLSLDPNRDLGNTVNDSVKGEDSAVGIATTKTIAALSTSSLSGKK